MIFNELIVTDASKIDDVSGDHGPVYVVPAGEHTIKVVPSSLWARQKIPVPGAGSIRVRLKSPSEVEQAGWPPSVKHPHELPRFGERG